MALHPTGIRDLRADLAAAVRRASGGQRIVISVGGRAVAQLGPIEPEQGQTVLADLIPSGAVIAPRRTDAARLGVPVPVWSGVRIDRALKEFARVTVFFDTSAVVAVHVESPARRIAAGVLEPSTCVSALALTEALALVSKLTDERVLQADLEDALRLQWDRYAVVPVDQRCLDRAAQLLRDQPLRLADAVHLAAADRLPRPLTFVTFDPAQIPVALALGFDVVSA